MKNPGRPDPCVGSDRRRVSGRRAPAGKRRAGCLTSARKVARLFVHRYVLRAYRCLQTTTRQSTLFQRTGQHSIIRIPCVVPAATPYSVASPIRRRPLARKHHEPAFSIHDAIARSPRAPVDDNLRGKDRKDICDDETACSIGPNLRRARAAQGRRKPWKVGVGRSSDFDTAWTFWVEEEQQEHQQVWRQIHLGDGTERDGCVRTNGRLTVAQRQLARDLRRPIYGLDLRNHGESPHDPRHDYEALAEDVEHFINKHRLSGSTLIGHSMGAKTVMTVALRSPHLVRDLIPVDNAPVDATLKTDFATYIKGMAALQEAELLKHSEANVFMKPYVPDDNVRFFLCSNLKRNEAGKLQFKIPVNYLAKALDNMGDFPFKNPDEARFEGRTLMVRGTKSHYVPDETLPIIGRFFPLFKYVDIDSGHWIISEKPEAFRQGESWSCSRIFQGVSKADDGALAAVIEFLGEEK